MHCYLCYYSSLNIMADDFEPRIATQMLEMSLWNELKVIAQTFEISLSNVYRVVAKMSEMKL